MKKKEWIDIIHDKSGSCKIQYNGDPIDYEEFVHVTRSMRPIEVKRIETRFEILDL